ncbi:MAG: hypothetical protein RL264_1426 [Bacteroidota bacterium]|jgi:hypothetical protein
MILKQLFYFLFFNVFWFNSFLAQTNADRKVIASAGRDANNGLTGLSQRFMTYTIGEPIIYRGSNSTRQLNNGFIQPIGITAVSPPNSSSIPLLNGEIAVYPNPFGTFITVNTSEQQEEAIRVQLIDINGKLILQDEILPNQHRLEIPSHCAPGTYLLNCYTLSGQFIQQTRLIKMDI